MLYNSLSDPIPITFARTFNIVGSPLICAEEQGCTRAVATLISYPYITCQQ
ncbi:hypothetical protein GQ55_4G198300 [Panicum hallii var. hallii]|uniref:Uncharacterized protein n=2 Tax=Panicum hallii TaxID=206008 RepID=A0A2T7DZ31_9POAL|nr:hypothetical protein GQ55_4G198300 [Panicum hallii var. hallii]PVH47912.1 hypothetical protein PAHAL_4G185100 [Panicum hallii]